jgi:(1->4)-alpha-D-glucan 1-alpha-D-glucosylmutase
LAPGRNEEYLIYQTLLGAWPLEPYGAEEYGAFLRRVQAYLEKAMREAKVHTSWTSPDADYESAVKEFVARLLDGKSGGEFLRDFRPFQKRVADLGLLNSLSQTLLKIAAPGVPDTYQGTELWDFSLVDPDNRRPVDYAKRQEMLRLLAAGADPAELLRRKEDGRVKLYVTWKALTARRERAGLFSEGEYLPAEITGARRDNVFAFARRRGGRVAVVAVPRLVTGLGGGWGDTRIELPLSPPRLRDVLTGRSVEPDGSTLSAATLFASFPVALLVSEGDALEGQ